MVPFRRSGRPPTLRVSHVNRQDLLFELELTPQVVDRVGEMTVVRRDVLAGDLGAELDRPAGRGTREVNLGVDEPSRLEDVPELVILGGGPAAERAAGPPVELQVDQLEVQVHRLAPGVAHPERAPGAEGRPAVGALGTLDRDQPVLRGDAAPRAC